MTENEEWLAVAESAFSDWDSSGDAVYDDQGGGCGKKLRMLLLFVVPAIILASCIVEVFGKWW